MRKLIFLLAIGFASFSTMAQSFELVDRQDNFQAGLSEYLRIPLRIKNNSDKPQFYIVRKISGDLGTTQRGYFCLEKNCQEQGVDEFTKRLEPGETLSGLFFTLETGLVSGQHNIRFEIFIRGNMHELIDHNVAVSIDEKQFKPLVFRSKEITIHDVYPNPATDQAFVDYELHNDNIKAKVVLHNILGSPVGNYNLPSSETKVKIQTDELSAGVYFYTIYLENDGVLTRKLVVRK